MRRGGLLTLALAAIAGVVLLLVLDGDGEVAGLASGDFAQGASLTILAVVIASGLLLRQSLSGIAKGMLVYGLGFVLLIGLYGYRAEFRQIGDRILAELVPGHVIAVAGSDARQVMVMRANDDHFHVDATVDGRPVAFLVDTGASLVALDRSSAQALGIDVESLGYTDRVMTANGPARAAPVVLASIRIGDIERRNVAAAVMDIDGDGLSLLGMSFLNTLSGFDFRGERLVLTD